MSSVNKQNSEKLNTKPIKQPKSAKHIPRDPPKPCELGLSSMPSSPPSPVKSGVLGVTGEVGAGAPQGAATGAGHQGLEASRRASRRARGDGAGASVPLGCAASVPLGSVLCATWLSATWLSATWLSATWLSATSRCFRKSIQCSSQLQFPLLGGLGWSQVGGNAVYSIQERGVRYQPPNYQSKPQILGYPATQQQPFAEFCLGKRSTQI